MDQKNYTSLMYLWDKRTLYLGPLFEPICMKNGAASIAFALTGTMKVRCPGQKELVECKSFLVPPGTPFTAYTEDYIIANCMLDVTGQDYAILSKQMMRPGGNLKNNVSFQIKDELAYISKLQDLYRSQHPWDVAAAELNQLLTPPERIRETPQPVDPRVEQIITFIKSNIDQNLSVDLLARQVNLSVPHLVKIFKAQTGVPIRRYRLWHRLFVASVCMAKTGNLTSAALNAGFSDASHFLHTFQDVLGMKASLLLNQPNKIDIIVEPSQ